MNMNASILGTDLKNTTARDMQAVWNFCVGISVIAEVPPKTGVPLSQLTRLKAWSWEPSVVLA